MFKKISDHIVYPNWVKRDPRYRKLDLLDRLLDGTFYDHLPHAYYDETEGQGNNARLILMEEKRPSSQFRLPRMVARYCSRKLFAGRHVPRIVHTSNPNVAEKVTALATKIQFWHTMLEVTLRGSVGSVAVTFSVDDDKDSVCLDVWRSKYCEPTFDVKGELIKLRVQYQTSRAMFEKIGATKDDLDSEGNTFWYIRDFTPQGETVYKPVPHNEWNPVDGFVGDNADKNALVEWEDKSKAHDFGVVTGHWFCNMSGGECPDGACTFEDAIPDSIELDYNLSQIGRGVRYNSSPQLVTVGNVKGGDNISRGPIVAIQMEGGYKDPEGMSFNEGDAKLLEMNGQGTVAALSFIDKLRNFGLEQISANRKDAEKMKGPLSGRAMEYLDEDANDLIMELRSTYGEYGCLCLLRKIVSILEPGLEVSQLSLRWPRLYQPTPHDLSEVIPALVAAVYPVATGAGGGDGEGAPKPLPGLLTVEEARQWLIMNMDLDMIDQPNTIGEGDDDADDDKEHPEDDIPVPNADLEGDEDDGPNGPVDQGPPEDGNDPGA
jgi:hypothetical protein